MLKQIILSSFFNGKTTLLERRMRGDQIETLKTIEFLIILDIFSIFLFKLEIYCQDRFQKLNL